MLEKEFEMWPANFFFDTIFITIGMHVTNLGYLEDRSPYFTKFSYGSIEELNKILVRLDTVAVIPKTDNQDLSDLIKLEVEYANKKKEEAERRRQKKINLAQATIVSNAPLSLDASTCCPLLSLITSGSGAGGMTISDTPLSLIAGNSPLSAVSGCFLSLFASSGPMFIILGRFSSLVAVGSSLSTVFGHLSSLVIGSGILFAVLDSLLSSIAGDGLLSTISGDGSSSSVPPADSQVLFLISTPFYTCHSSLLSLLLFHSFLFFLPTTLACNPASLTEKRLFDQAFMIQRPIAST